MLSWMERVEGKVHCINRKHMNVRTTPDPEQDQAVKSGIVWLRM